MKHQFVCILDKYSIRWATFPAPHMVLFSSWEFCQSFLLYPLQDAWQLRSIQQKNRRWCSHGFHSSLHLTFSFLIWRCCLKLILMFSQVQVSGHGRIYFQILLKYNHSNLFFLKSLNMLNRISFGTWFPLAWLSFIRVWLLSPKAVLHTCCSGTETIFTCGLGSQALGGNEANLIINHGAPLKLGKHRQRHFLKFMPEERQHIFEVCETWLYLKARIQG